MNLYSVIMAGGAGTRFWPASRKMSPKQILNLTGNDVLINETINRMEGVVPAENILVVTNVNQRGTLENVIDKRIDGSNILYEPVSRNTAPCIGYAAAVIAGRNKDQDAIMCVFPADHYCKDEEAFKATFRKACLLAEKEDKLVTIGITPTFPCTGYGYIHFGDMHCSTPSYIVKNFVEKPDLDIARQYVDSGRYLWNSGMFIWRVSTILKNFERFMPRLYDMLMELTDYVGTPEEKSALERIYPDMESISIDYGIMERSMDVLVIPGDFGWSDMGSWDALESVYEKDEKGNIFVGNHVASYTKNSILYGEGHLIATIGLENMIVVHTEDATLVCPKENAQDVKHIVDVLNKMGRTDLL